MTLIDFWPSFCLLLAQAPDAPPADGGQPPNPLFQMLLIFAPIVVLWYLLVLKPQNKERSKRQDMLKALKKNDPVVTIGGIMGTVVNVTEDGEEVTVRVDDNTRLKLRRDAIREVVVKDKAENK
ncbi:MAG: preprotein translocase subunit YajC [Planctomycetaceae bacterium]